MILFAGEGIENKVLMFLYFGSYFINARKSFYKNVKYINELVGIDCS